MGMFDSFESAVRINCRTGADGYCANNQPMPTYRTEDGVVSETDGSFRSSSN